MPKDGRISLSRKWRGFKIFKRGAKECHVACCTIRRSWMKSTRISNRITKMNQGPKRKAKPPHPLTRALNGSIPATCFNGETLNNCKADFLAIIEIQDACARLVEHDGSNNSCGWLRTTMASEHLRVRLKQSSQLSAIVKLLVDLCGRRTSRGVFGSSEPMKRVC
jgi:hypothetical protein